MIDRPERLKYLVEHGFDLNAEMADGACTPLMVAADMGRASAVQYLLNQGCDPNHRNRFGETALTIVEGKIAAGASRGYLEIRDILRANVGD